MGVYDNLHVKDQLGRLGTAVRRMYSEKFCVCRTVSNIQTAYFA